jgi:hypothetical protein
VAAVVAVMSVQPTSENVTVEQSAWPSAAAAPAAQIARMERVDFIIVSRVDFFLIDESIKDKLLSLCNLSGKENAKAWDGAYTPRRAGESHH